MSHRSHGSKIGLQAASALPESNRSKGSFWSCCELVENTGHAPGIAAVVEPEPLPAFAAGQGVLWKLARKGVHGAKNGDDLRASRKRPRSIYLLCQSFRAEHQAETFLGFALDHSENRTLDAPQTSTHGKSSLLDKC